MINLLNSRYFYFIFPIYFSLTLILIFYNVPNGFHASLISLFIVITPVVFLSEFIYPGRLEIDKSYQYLIKNEKYKIVMIMLSCIVLLSGPIDVYINGFKPLDPLSYAEFSGVGRYIRHISISCWILIPISYIFIKNLNIRRALIVYAVVFPMIILDRNRLLMSFYTLIFCIFNGLNSCAEGSETSRRGAGYFYLIALGFILAFSLLGLYRSGDVFLVESSGEHLEFGALPLSTTFYKLPELLQQVVLYITTPIFNFSTIVYFDFLNDIFLLSQFSPFGRDLYDVYPDAPVMVDRFNVGTEFYPWLLYAGLPAVVGSFAFMLFFFFGSVHLLKRCPNIFTLIIFLRISYTVLFMGFAPQFYILLNFAFISLMLGIWGGVEVLKVALGWSAGTNEQVICGKS